MDCDYKNCSKLRKIHIRDSLLVGVVVAMLIFLVVGVMS